MILIFTFVLGLIFGSFLNVCIYRIPRNESISYPPSHCTGCGNRIKPYDLIPVLSYIFLKGKCRYCGEKISLRYPLIELLTGILFAVLYIKFDIGFEFIKYCVLVCFLIIIGFIDLDTTDVYFKTTMGGILSGIFFIFLGVFLHMNIMQPILGGLIGGGAIAAIVIATHGMGWGDFEICLMCGLFLGVKLTLIMLFFSFLFGGAIGALLIILKIKSRKDYIPFGPFIAAAAIFAIFFGNSIFLWYFSRFMF